jgi:short-subunit dehydrogenase
MNGTWLILGASSGLARAFARAAAAANDVSQVILAGRDRQDLERSAADLELRYGIAATVVAFEATDIAAQEEFVTSIGAQATGPLHVFFAVGQMLPQAELERQPTLAADVVDANYRGAVVTLLHLANLLEARGTGSLVVIGSVAGDRGRRSNYLYGSTKAALAVFVAGLRLRLGVRDIPVMLVKPGFLDTAMTWTMPTMGLAAAPDAAARAIWRARSRRRHEIYVPFFWRHIMTIIKGLPYMIFKRLPL